MERMRVDLGSTHYGLRQTLENDTMLSSFLFETKKEKQGGGDTGTPPHFS